MSQDDETAILDQLETLVNIFRQKKYMELEAVFSMVPSSEFPKSRISPSGVSFSMFNNIYNTLERSADNMVLVRHNVMNIVDYCFPGNIRGRYDASGLVPPVYVHKTPITKMIIMSHDRPGIQLRINLKSEQECDDVPAGPPLIIRLQQRWRYVYNNYFIFDLKKVVTGVTKEEACKAAPVFEVEIELMRNKKVLNARTDAMIASSMICKIKDIMGRYNNGVLTDIMLSEV